MRRVGALTIPRPPEAMQFGAVQFAPAEGMDEFVRATFLDTSSPLFIVQHEILEQARIGYLWAFPQARDRNRTIVGQAQLIRPPQQKWSSLRSLWQVGQWFGDVDFMITLSAPYVLEVATEPEVLALIDHELCHCVQDSRDGMPLFTRDGTPIWGMAGHDVEQFVGVADRWGAGAAGVEQLAAAASRKPRFGGVDLQRVIAGCGTRLGRAA